MEQKPFEDDDPMELVGVAFPAGEVGQMAEAIVEEFIKLGFDDEELLGLFRSPGYHIPHVIYRENGEEYVKALVQRIRERWGILRFTETRSFHQVIRGRQQGVPASGGIRPLESRQAGLRLEKEGRKMPEVYNWQLGRKMHFPYEEAHPRWQFAAVFNTNRCIGCQTCSMACKSTWTFSKGQEYMWWNNVETKPYGGYPQFWDVKLLKLLEEAHQREGTEATWDASKRDGAKSPYGVYQGMTIFEAALKRYGPEGHTRALGYLPADEEWRAPNIYEDTAPSYEGGPMGLSKEGVSLPEHKTWFFHLQRICNHCTYPGCLAACPRKAIYKRPEDGIVLIDQERCRGYKKCVEGCPYKKPMFRSTTRVSEKCVACYPRIEGRDPHITPDGVPIEARCMAACVGKIRLQGLVKIEEKTGDWAEDRSHPLYFLVKVEKVALPLYPQFGTEPNIYYIPPRWVPRSYLRQMFGPGADEAVERYVAPSRELLAVLQLFRSTQKIIFRYEIIEGKKVFETEIAGKLWAMYNDTVVGFDKNRKEIVRLTVEEPVYVRPAKHPNSI